MGYRAVCGHERQGEPETGAFARFAPRFEPALVQACVLDADGQAESGATGAARDGSDRQESVELEFLFAWPQADAIVADGDRDGVAVDRMVRVTGLCSPWSMALASRLLRIRSTRRGSISARTGSAGRSRASSSTGVIGEVADGVASAPSMGMAMSMPFGGQFGHAGVVAGDLEQFGEQGFESVEFFVEEFDGSFVHGVECVAGFVETGQRPCARL